MRIGTWNLAGRWSRLHEKLMQQQNCDVWLLTETSERLALEGYMKHSTNGCMAHGRRWASILSQEEMIAAPDPHAASTLVSVGDLKFCCSILPWRSCPSHLPWIGKGHAEKTKATLDELLANFPHGEFLWGGDWNHALSGREYAGSQDGRSYLLEVVKRRDLKVPTATLPHRLPNLLTIDHIAVPKTTRVISACRVDASADGQRLSDHDAYVVEVRIE
jgi:hypothetical protein